MKAPVMKVKVDDLPLVAEVWGLPYMTLMRAWSLVYVHREMLSAKGPLPILRWAPLEAALGRGPDGRPDDMALGGRLGIDRGNVVRCRRMRMLTIEQADRYCAKAGLHPRQVWGDWYYAACAVLKPVDLADVLAEDVAAAIGGCELVASYVALTGLAAWRSSSWCAA